MDELAKLLVSGEASWLDAGGVSMIIVVIIKLIHDIIRALLAKRTPSEQQNLGEVDWSKLVLDLHDMHTWLKKEDADGVKLWYNKRSVEMKLDSVLAQQKQLIHSMKELKDDLGD